MTFRKAGDTPNTPPGNADPAAQPAVPSTGTSMADALGRLRASRTAPPGPERPTSGSPQGGETSAPGRTPSRGVLDDGGQSGQEQRPDKSEEDEDDFLSTLDDDSPGEPAASKPPASGDGDDPIVWTDDDGTPVRRSEARNGWLRRKDYSAKTEQASALRRDAEAKIAEAQRAREDYVKLLNAAQETAKSNMPQMPNAELRQTDPLLYQEKVADFLLAEKEIKDRQAEMERVAQEHYEAGRQQFEQKRLEEQRKMIETVPTLRKIANDPAKLSAAFNNYRRGAKHYGYSDQELNSLVDHRAIRLLDDALRWRAYVRKKSSGGRSEGGERSTSVAPEVTLKGTTGGGGIPMSGSGDRKVTDARAELRKTGKMEDAMAVLRARRLAKATARS